MTRLLDTNLTSEKVNRKRKYSELLKESNQNSFDNLINLVQPNTELNNQINSTDLLDDNSNYNQFTNACSQVSQTLNSLLNKIKE